MLRQCELSAGRVQAVDHLDGNHVGGANGFLALGNMTVDNLLELEMSPQPESQPDVAELARVGPAHGFQAHPDEVGIIWQRDVVVVGEETELTTFSLPVVKRNGTLPTPFLVVVEFAEMGYDPLMRPGFGADAFHHGVVGMRLAAFGAVVAS